MSPQFVDINADGFDDIIVGTFEGVVFGLMGSEKGFAKPEYLLDSNGETILIEHFWDMDLEKWTTSDRAATADCDSRGQCTSTAVVDWDDDGDLDLLLGDYREGRIYLRINEGTPQKPSFATGNQSVMAAGQILMVPSGLAAPRVVDWNGDGLFDLVCGASKGGVYFFANTGKVGQPQFARAEVLIKPVVSSSGYPEVPARDGQPLMPGSSLHVDVADYDGDGDLDLLVGGNSFWRTRPAKQLTDDQASELKTVDEEINSLYADLNKMMKGFDSLDEEKRGTAMEELRASKEYQELTAQMSKLKSRYLELANHPDADGYFVWLYRRK